MTNGEWFDNLSNKQLEKWRNQEHISNKKRKKIGRWFGGTDIHLLINEDAFNNSHSGARGVRWHKGQKKWYAEIKLFQKKIHLGSFDLFDDAVKARKKAENEIYKPIIEAYRTFEKYSKMTRRCQTNDIQIVEQNLFDNGTCRIDGK
jgi:hypothetical protein